MSNSTICAECNVNPTHHLCITCKNTLVCPICLDKRVYDDLNYCRCKSCDPNANDKN